MRIAVIDRKKCSPDNCGYACIKVCPGVRMGQETIVQGSDKFPVISEELCTGCGICTKKCPYSAIAIINLPYELNQPLHQYGQNSFRVYGLPAPADGVVGLVGSNGIGKSTLLNIMSGNLVPNFGDFSAKPNWETVIENLKGKDVQKHFKLIADKKLKVSYKPQDITSLPKNAKGKAGQLLKKVDERGALKEIIGALELENALNRTLKELSGGELQRVAIAAALARDAELYFLDEPSSFLDIRQRLNAAKLIREVAETKRIIVVEHDLAVLDYLADYIYVLFGKAGCFGIVSGLKAARTGINEFLDGFLKSENMRIRDYAIRFETKPPSMEWKGKKTIAYESFAKEYKGGFKLDAEPGQLVRGEVLAVMGPNAIGKSTFMKVLAGEGKPTSGAPNMRATISYKPQYISIDFDGSVRDFIAAQKNMDTDLFDAELRRYVTDLFDKNALELSGGEAQRLAIAMALATKAELCLLDEPSASLDIEQRLELAALVKRITEKTERTALVVDHDIVFQDLVANRVMIFEGKPSKSGSARSPQSMRDGMNSFLSAMGITFRRDENTKRPRMNKPGSQKDVQQRQSGEYYYAVG